MRIFSLLLSQRLLGVAVWLGTVGLGYGATNAAAPWQFKREFLPALVQAVLKLLRTQDPDTGHFGSGLWIPDDQNVIYPLAAVWSLPASGNRYYHDTNLLAAIMSGGDALIEAQGKDGRWMFRKKDNSTWGLHYDPWCYSRWVRTYSLIREAMPPQRRERWQKALELGFTGIDKRELGHVHNIPTHHAMALYIAGQALNHPEWCAHASAFLRQVAAKQDPNGFWSEHVGPVVNYNLVYFDALGTYYSVSHDTNVLCALERAARFHANFTYPDGSSIAAVDERNPYSPKYPLPNVGFTFSAEGRSYLRWQWQHLQEKGLPPTLDVVASLLLYGEEGPAALVPGANGDSVFVTTDSKAAVLHRGPWCACLSAYTGPLSSSRWIQDRQNLVSLFHTNTGLILGGGNTKLQPLWSTFTVGDPSLLRHRVADEQPNFSEPVGLVHVPASAALGPDNQSLELVYGGAQCRVALDLSQRNTARLTYIAQPGTNPAPIEAHVPFLPTMGKAWRTASGKQGRLGAGAFTLSAKEAGAWFEHNGWRVRLPPGATLTWPVWPHNPYRKDGRAEPAEGRIVLSLPVTTTNQEVVVSAAP